MHLQKLREMVSTPPPPELQQDAESLQTDSDELLELLQRQAEGCQEKLRRKIAPEADAGLWHKHETTRDTIKNIIGAEAYDPGIMTERELRETAKELHGGHFHKLNNIARLDLRFDKCENLLQCIGTLKKLFDVRGVINRFSKRLHATLGWCEVVVVCVEVLEDDSEHVCAIRLMHSALVEAHAANAEDMSEMQRVMRNANDPKAAQIMDAALHRREAFERAIGEQGWQAIVQQRVLDWS